MSSRPILKAPLIFRLLGLLAMVGWLALFCGLLSESPGQQPAAKQRVEEDVGPAKKPIRVDDGASTATTGLALFLREATQGKQPAPVIALYSRLAVPHDEVRGADGEIIWVEPLRRYVGARPLAETVPARQINDKGVFLGIKALKPADVTAVRHYEELALDEVARFRNTPVKPNLSATETLLHAERVLAETVRFHEASREREQRSGPGWSDVEKKLRPALMLVRLDLLKELAKSRDTAALAEQTRLLAQTYPGNPEVRNDVIAVHVQQAERTLEGNRIDAFVQVRQGLEQLERLFPGSLDDAAMKQVNDRLAAKAKSLAADAEKLAATDRAGAQKTVRLAESIWPSLSVLARLRRELQMDSVLYVGVRDLPTFLSPATASNEAERQSLELLFESLVRPVPDPAVGLAYEPVLAASSPRILPLGRDVQLVRDARWYRESQGPNVPAIDAPVTATDVGAMVRLFQKEPVQSPEWNEIIDGVREKDQLNLQLTFHRGYFNPLSLMTFKVLPPKYLAERLDNPDFAQHPIGSGPYSYVGREIDQRTRVEYAVFRANPTYGSRSGKQGQPFIRDIRFYSIQGRDPRIDFQHGPQNPPLHLLLDVSGDTAKGIVSPNSGLKDSVAVKVLPSRRIYFLAINHRQPALQNENLRRALSASLDRETILNQFFRDTDAPGPKLHRALNGPYPPDSWACANSRNLRAGLFDPEKARTWANQAKAAGATLTLKYPLGDPDVARAVAALCAQVKQHTDIALEPVGCPPSELRQAVEVDHKYELAYYHWDYADESYWLWPLLESNATGPGGTNFLGCKDAALDNRFAQVMKHRDFGELQRLTHNIHRHLDDTMPFVPLWQLDVQIAIHHQLKTVPVPDRLDPLLLFSHAARWKLEKDGR